MLSSNLMKELAANELLNPDDCKSEATQKNSGQSTISAQVVACSEADSMQPAPSTIEMCSLACDATSEDD